MEFLKNQTLGEIKSCKSEIKKFKILAEIKKKKKDQAERGLWSNFLEE